MPSAPPLPPSPLTMTTMGVSRSIMSRRLTAIASATPRSSDSMPGYAAGVSTNTMTGRPNFSARRLARSAVRQQLERLDLLQQDGDRLFEVQGFCGHRVQGSGFRVQGSGRQNQH